MTDVFNRFDKYKILAHADRLRAAANGERPYPIDWHIYPSNICNHSCTWCAATGTLIATPRGDVPIESLLPGDYVYGPSGRVNTIGQVGKRTAHDIYEVTIGDRRLVCSGEHPILTQDGWKEAHDCQPGRDAAVVRVRVRTAGQDASGQVEHLRIHASAKDGRSVGASEGDGQRANANTQPDARSGGSEAYRFGEAWEGSADARRESASRRGVAAAYAFGPQSDERSDDSPESASKALRLPEAVGAGSPSSGVVTRLRDTGDVHRVGRWHHLGRQESARLSDHRPEEGHRGDSGGDLQQPVRSTNTRELRLAVGSALPEMRVAGTDHVLPRSVSVTGASSPNPRLRLAGIELERGLALQPITAIRRLDGPLTVYNFSCTPDEAYEANGIVVHNCLFRQNGEQENYAVKLPRQLLLKAVEDAARTGAVLLHFSGGGEPLLNRYTLEAMQAARATQRLDIALSTNGSLLTPEVAQEVDYLRVSLNAGTAYQHWRTNHEGDIRHPGDFDTIIENIRRALPFKRRDLGLGFVVDYENWDDIYPFCHLAADLGVDFVHIRPAFYYDDDHDKWTRKTMEDAFRECDRARQDFGSRVPIYAITEKFDGYWTARPYDKCRAIWTGVCLRATGDFAVCQDRTDLVFGQDPNYREGATFEEVWHSEEHQRVTDLVVSPGVLDTCPRCVWNHRNTIIEHAFVKDEMRLTMV